MTTRKNISGILQIVQMSLNEKDGYGIHFFFTDDDSRQQAGLGQYAFTYDNIIVNTKFIIQQSIKLITAEFIRYSHKKNTKIDMLNKLLVTGTINNMPIWKQHTQLKKLTEEIAIIKNLSEQNKFYEIHNIIGRGCYAKTFKDIETYIKYVIINNETPSINPFQKRFANRKFVHIYHPNNLPLTTLKRNYLKQEINFI